MPVVNDEVPVEQVEGQEQGGVAVAEAPVAEKPKKAKPKGDKKPAAPKAKPAPKVDKKAKADPEPKGPKDPDRTEAKKLGLTLPQFKVCRFMAKKPDQTYTYLNIKDGTGYYSSLTQMMRAAHADSTTDKGFTKELSVEEAGKSKVAFVLTARGKKAFAK